MCAASPITLLHNIVSGLWASQASGVAVREYGRVVPLGSDGSYMVYERLDYAETKRRAPDAAAAMKRLKSLARGQTWREQGDEEVRARRAWGGGLTVGADRWGLARVHTTVSWHFLRRSVLILITKLAQVSCQLMRVAGS